MAWGHDVRQNGSCQCIRRKVEQNPIQILSELSHEAEPFFVCQVNVGICLGEILFYLAIQLTIVGILKSEKLGVSELFNLISSLGTAKIFKVSYFALFEIAPQHPAGMDF